MAASSSSDDEDSWPSSSSSQCSCRPTGSGTSHRRSAAGGPRPAPGPARGAPDSQSLGSPAGHEAECAETPPRPSVLSSFDLDGVAEYVLTHGCSRIIVMVGAGISVSAGLPDFRTPGSGLYDNLAKYNLPEPTAVFNIDFFRQNPAPFYMLAKELFPGQFQPTPTHHFIRLLHDRGLLLRCFTQNIDSLEAEAGIPRDKIVAAHGNFDSATCLDTGAKVPISEVREAIMAGEEGWRAMNARWGGLVKPDISFFGERLPDRFYERAGLLADSVDSDFAECDLLIVMGTSLVVQPFASLIDRVPDTCPRLLLNRQPVALYNPVLAELSGEPQGFRFRDPSNWRDVCFLCSTDDGVKKLAALLGWSRELDARVDACGGWPAPGPEIEQLSAPKKQLSKQTVAAAVQVLRKLLGGGGKGSSVAGPQRNRGVAGRGRRAVSPRQGSPGNGGVDGPGSSAWGKSSGSTGDGDDDDSEEEEEEEEEEVVDDSDSTE